MRSRHKPESPLPLLGDTPILRLMSDAELESWHKLYTDWPGGVEAMMPETVRSFGDVHDEIVRRAAARQGVRKPAKETKCDIPF